MYSFILGEKGRSMSCIRMELVKVGKALRLSQSPTTMLILAQVLCLGSRYNLAKKEILIILPPQC